MKTGALPAIVREEWLLGVSIATGGAFLEFGDVLLAEPQAPLRLTVVFLWLFAVMLGSALAVVRHAERLAERLGEPYGTLILTLSVTFIEVVSISAVMLHGENNPTLARDTLFAVVMIILNGMVGVSLLVGGWRHREQHYNLQGANTYLSVIIPLAVLSLILPDYTTTTAGPTLSFLQEMFLVLMSVGLYCAFLAIQTGRHRAYFIAEEEKADPPAPQSPSSPLLSAILLAAYMAPVVFLAEQLAQPIDYLLETLRAPAALGGVVIAVLVATPEALGAVRAATANHLQRSINIFLGSVLSTIGLTVPAMIAISHLTGHSISLGLQNADFVMLLLTLAVSVVTFASGRTNVLQGAVHLLLFAAYLLLIFQG
ncbi:MAG TPA: ionic transporter y4hA [Burkholderiales bacterium]|nr:ionic transporter y4hA [Burkholderiales bacterium]